jgi:hypothetical protein
MGLFSRKKRGIAEELDVPSAPEEEIEEMPKFPEIPEEFKPLPEEEKLRPPEIVEEARELIEPTKPLFIEVNDFKEVLEEIGMMKTILKEADDAAARTEEFAADEDKELRKWETVVSDAQRKLIYCDKILFR